ncbi:Putative 115 kDa protein in type-1 retrotransposable element R1DM [Eumeta japonica]|uniref:115 kDa protein in type-1 retrotransposable element R1DM n=1 Tax=Eumeta variegata TaxID=151549 RepID=A0A4C1UB99_EUMVA|nr:Putative 115 kDa protein in type-1 retrotransposable element R1DM [Eumeta japonica]
MDAALIERGLTVEMVKSVGSCDQLDEIGSGRGAGRELEAVLLSTGRSLWDGIYRVIRETGKNREDVLLQTDSGRVLDSNESATLLAQTLFFDDRVDTDDPHYAEVRRQTDGDDQPPVTSKDLPGVDSPFTGAEVRNALKAFHPRNAPDIDAFTSDICQAVIFQDLRLFLAMANKCLELEYFPWAWKVAAIKVIPKPDKNDYTRPKSYRPIGLLRVEKNRGKDAGRALPMALDAEAAGDAVWLHAAAWDGGRPQ